MSRNYQFGTNLELNGQTADVLQETKLLGTIITDDLRWTKNTEFLVKKANARMRICLSSSDVQVSAWISLSFYKDWIETWCLAASNWNIPLIFSSKTIFGNYILMCHSFMEIDLKYKDPLLALKLSLINFWPLEFSLLWSVSIKFNTFQKPQGHTL